MLPDKPEPSVNLIQLPRGVTWVLLTYRIVKMAYHIAVGSYSDQVHFLKFDPEISSLTVLPSITVGYHPSWLTPHHSDPSIIYAGIEQSDGRVVTLKLEQDGRVAILADISSGGDSPCTLLTSQDELLIGNVSSLG